MEAGTGNEKKSDDKKRILVLMSTYNGEKYIEEQIKSIFSQTIANQVTLWVRDDGSEDATVSIIEKLKDRCGDQIRLIKGQNIGYNASFFKLLDLASGYDYYALSDQDDVWLACKLEVAEDIMKKEDDRIPLLYASTSFLVYEDLKPYGQTRRKQRPFTVYNTAIQNICPGHTQIFNNALLEIIQKEHVDPGKIYVYDSWITSHAALYGKILFNNSSFTLYRQHKGNQFGSGAGKWGQLIASIKRDESGDGYKYRKQIEYFVEKNERELKRQGKYGELKKFIDARNIKQKIKYLSHSKLYRQNRIETFVFDMAVLCGKY